MRNIIIAVIGTLLLAVPATAAVTAKTFYLNRGDVAIAAPAAVQCLAVGRGINAGFRCYTGGDYRGRYGVYINAYGVRVLQYRNMTQYTTIYRRSMP